MSNLESLRTFEDVALELRDLDGVTLKDEGLYIHGRRFAFLDAQGLVIELSAKRLADLVARGFGTPTGAPSGASRPGLLVTDRQLWRELAEEACEFVGEPATGGQS